MPSTPEQPYAKCAVCELEFADKEAARKHSEETMTPTGATTGVVASGHRFIVVNPTPAERQASLVRSAIFSALDSFYDQLDSDVQRGRFTEAEVKEQLSWFDLGDGWDEYIAEGQL